MRTFSISVTNYYKWILTIWILLLITMAIFAMRLPDLLAGDGFKMDGEHQQVMDELTSTFHLPAETLFIVFDDVTDTQISATLAKIERLNIAKRIQSPFLDSTLYKDHISYATLQFDQQLDEMSDIVTSIRDEIGMTKGITLTGTAAISNDINEASQKDLAYAETIGLPIALIVLLFAFGSVIASFLPIVIGIATIIPSFGILSLISDYSIDLSIFILNIVPMIGLALSIDFALLFINRYREERLTSTIIEAIQTTIQTAGRSIIFSAICVFIGLGAMMVIQVEIFQNIAVGGTIVVFIAVLATLTLLPSCIQLLGDRLNKWTIIRVNQHHHLIRWRNFATLIMKYPKTIVIIAIIFLSIGILPVKEIKLTIPQVDSLPESYDSRKALEQMEDEFGLGDSSLIYILAKRENGWETKEGLAAMKNLEESLLKDSLVQNVSTIFSESNLTTVDQWLQSMDIPSSAQKLQPLFETYVKGDQLLIPVTLDAKGTSKIAQDWTRDWSEKHQEKEILLGGKPKFNQEIFDEIYDKMAITLTIILISTFIILMLAFQSVLIPLKAILMNIISLSSTFGILVFIFQYGHFGFEAGTIALIIPVIVFSLVFGLSMDYEVFLISRIQEEYRKTFNNTDATIDGLTNTSKIITSAALIMIVITGAFAFTDVLPVKQIGVGIAIAVALDASIIRLLLIPSLMKLLGDWNWWMPFRKGPYRSRSWH